MLKSSSRVFEDPDGFGHLKTLGTATSVSGSGVGRDQTLDRKCKQFTEILMKEDLDSSRYTVQYSFQKSHCRSTRLIFFFDLKTLQSFSSALNSKHKREASNSVPDSRRVQNKGGLGEKSGHLSQPSFPSSPDVLRYLSKQKSSTKSGKGPDCRAGMA